MSEARNARSASGAAPRAPPRGPQVAAPPTAVTCCPAAPLRAAMEDDDPVVREIPVFLSQTLSKQLYLFQYPMKPTEDNWNDSKVINSKIKPIHKQVKLEFGINSNSNRYDSTKAERIALYTDGALNSSMGNKEKDKDVCFKSGYMDKLQFESSVPITDSNKYTVAVLHDGEMHVTPINGILQMRPAFTYLDKQDKRAKEEEAKNLEADETIGADEQEAKQVTVSFARTETERIKKAREKSYGYLTQKSSEEPWCDSTWWHSNTDQAELERVKLFASNSSDDLGRLNLPPDEYLTSLVPRDAESLEASHDSSSDITNLSELKKLNLAEQCKIILRDAKLVTVGWVSSLTNSTGPPLLIALSAAGRLLQGGRWAARSSLIYPPGSVSQHSGVSDLIMCRARDYVLYLFTQSQYVDRRKVAAAVRLPPEEVKELLSSVACYKCDKGWELFIPPDLEFEKKYPDVVQRQGHFWEARQRQFNEMLSGEQVTLKRQRKKSQRDSCSSDNGMASPKIRGNIINSHKDSISSDNETSGDGKKVRKNSSSMGSCGKRTKHPSGGLNNFNLIDNNRVS